jgi:hypothetical protein
VQYAGREPVIEIVARRPVDRLQKAKDSLTLSSLYKHDRSVKGYLDNTKSRSAGQPAHKTVALFADRTQPASLSAGSFTGIEAQVADQFPAAGKAINLAHEINSDPKAAASLRAVG